MSLIGCQDKVYTLATTPFNGGGEGDIYDITGVADKCAKVYHVSSLSKELEEKLTIMVKRSPSKTVLTSVAWPVDLLYDSNRSFVGFVMPKLDFTEELWALYVYPPIKYKNITLQQKLIVAQNICAVISEVHKAGYVFGDFNPNNIGVNLNTGNVAFLDTDSYHIQDPESKKTYRCKVCLDGYVAPELLAACKPYKKDAYASAPLPTFTKETDNFALAIHIFKLLMNGYTPFNGIKETQTASTGAPGVGNSAIERDNYCFKPGNKPMSTAVPPLEILPDEIADLFTRAFMYGRFDPKQRPTATEWHKAMLNYEKELKSCSVNPSHQYMKTLNSCPWCEADKRYQSGIASSIGQRSFVVPVTPTPPPLPPQPAGGGTAPTGIPGQNTGHPYQSLRTGTNNTKFPVISLTLFLLFSLFSFLAWPSQGLTFETILDAVVTFVPARIFLSKLVNWEHKTGNHKMAQKFRVAILLTLVVLAVYLVVIIAIL